jgi:hypothetical protein
VRTILCPTSRIFLLDVCLLVLLSSICAAVAEDGELPVRNYVLTSRCEALLTSEHEAALENGRKNGGALNRGPGRYFLESRGIEFPYRASAILEDGAILKVINSAENLTKVNDLFEKLYSDEIDLEPVIARIVVAKRQLGTDVFAPSAETMAAVKAKSEADKPPPKAAPLFSPSTMDVEHLVHGSVVYTNVKVTSVTPAWLSIAHSMGVTRIPLAELEPEDQQRYEYDSTKAQAFLEAERKSKEQALQPVVASSISSPQVDDSPPAGSDNEEPAANSKKEENTTNGRAGNSRSYDKLLCRDGRLFENVDVQADHMGFTIRRQAETGKIEEQITFWDAPSSLLLDFEKFEELFSRMLVAKDRTQLYELKRDGVDGGKPFHELAKDPPVGRGFVSVPEGYVFANMNWMSLPQPAVELVRGIGTRSFALGDAAKLVGLSGSEWWNKYAGHKTPRLSVPSKLVKKEPSKLGVLYSVFNPEVPILGNTGGEILNLWVDGRSDENGLLALVETGNGLFLGYYQEHAALGGGELTWEDAIRDKTKRFQLRRMGSQKIRQGERLLKLFDASARRILGAEFKEVGQLKLSARHYHAILERGVEAAVQDRVLPKGDGVQFPELGVAATTSPSFEKVVITDQVVAKLKDVLPQTYVFDVESQQRVIEIRKREAGGRVSLQESNPKRQKQNEVIDISPDLDGGLRLTDGKVIYELKPVLGGTELVVWEAEPNKLKRF